MATPSARNFGQSPLTSRVGGGNGFSRAFYDQNPDYMGAGDWRYTDRNPGDDGFRIDARVGASMPGTGPGTGNTSIPMGRGFSGLDYYHALQNRNLPAFRQPNQGTPWGMGNSAQEAGANLTQSGNILRSDGPYIPDTMYNRTLGSMNPYSGGGSRIDKWGNQMAGPSQIPSQPQVMEDENGEPFNPENPAPSISRAAPPTRPMSNLRPLAEEIRARRDFATGNTPATFSNPMENPNADEMNPQPIMGSKFGRYGSGSSLIGSPSGPKVTSGGVMPNPITGQMTKMNPYLQEQRDVQDTKYSPNTQGAKQIASAFSATKPLDAAKGQYFRDKVRGAA